MIIISGNKNQGKTTQIKKIIAFLKDKNVSVLGFYSEKMIKHNKKIGYDIIEIATRKTFPFLRLDGVKAQQKIGNFYIDKETLKKGIKIIEKAIKKNPEFIIIDEVGKLELNNNGWSAILTDLFSKYSGKIILTVRTDFVEKIIKKWQLKDVQLLSVSDKYFLELIYNL